MRCSILESKATEPNNCTSYYPACPDPPICTPHHLTTIPSKASETTHSISRLQSLVKLVLPLDLKGL